MRFSIFGSLRAPPPAVTALVYRLRQWPGHLPAPLYTASVLRVLSLMSTRPVSRDWIQRHSGLKAGALDQFLDLLVARGELDVVDTSAFAPG